MNGIHIQATFLLVLILHDALVAVISQGGRSERYSSSYNMCGLGAFVGPYYARRDKGVSSRIWAEELPEGFNPFQRRPSQSNSSPLTSPIINPRKSRMTVITSELMRQSDVETMQDILQENKDFLLEPLENNDAFLDADSIYASSMTRDERYSAYRNSMQDRLSKSKSPQARMVLTAMMEFILSYE